MNGIEYIAAAFSRQKELGRAALMPYFTLGFPDKETSLRVVEAIAAAGADLLELGLPFSDPLADGPTIQHSAQVALENGLTIHDCLEMVRELRQRRITQPLLLMGYYNPILAYGVEKFAADASSSGASGLIVPDLPLEEATALESACRDNGMALVYLAAPTTPADRLAQLASRSTGFVYIVSLVGVTGARRQINTALPEFLGRVRQVTDKPVAVGFGISTPEQAARVGMLTDGVIVGSALIDVAAKADDPVKAAGSFIASLSAAIANGRTMSPGTVATTT
jgi:tryptophan synthase alpha chain